MQEVFEKIKERLKERLKFYENRFAEMSGTDRDVEVWGSIKSYKDAIEIANKVEEEYNNDVCEWKLEENTGIAWHCSDEKCSTYNDSYIKNLRIVFEDFGCVCPYCGKRIEVVE